MAPAGATPRTVQHRSTALSPERNPRRRYLQDVGNTDPAALPQRLPAPKAHRGDDADEPDPSAPEAPEQIVKQTLTSSQVYRVHLAEGNCRALRDMEFLDMSPADQVLYFDRLRRDNEELLRIIRLTTEGS